MNPYLSLDDEQGILALPLLAAYLLAKDETGLSLAEADPIIARKRERITQLSADIAAMENIPEGPDTAEWNPFPNIDIDEEDDETPLERLEGELRECEAAIQTALRRSGRVPVSLPDPRNEGLTTVQEAALKHLAENEAEFVTAVQSQVLASYKHFYQDSYWREIAQMTPADTFAELVGRFYILNLEITRWEKKTAFILVRLIADWEDDHGLYVVYRQGKKATWGTADTAHEEVAADPVAMKAWEAQQANPAAQLYQEAIDAAMEGNIKKLERLVAKGVNLNYPDDDSYSPLWHAINEYNAKTVRFLLENGADPFRREDGKTALGTARELFHELSWVEKPKGLLMKGAALFAKLVGGVDKMVAKELKSLREIIHLLEERMGISKTDF